MRAYRVTPGEGIDVLRSSTRTSAPLGPNDVRVRIRAVSLNYRDLMVARGTYGIGNSGPVIPCSDGAGEILETGSAVSRFREGDRVTSCFFPHWIDGKPSASVMRSPLGADDDGVLAEEVVSAADTWCRLPDALSYEEGATLPCAGVTAWHALFEARVSRPSETVLVLGTGGVSMFALQIAAATGRRTIVTSSSDAKLARARELGASETINYRSMPDWQDEVNRLTDGQGVDLAVEVGGEGTLDKSIASTGYDGTVAIIGGVAGFGAQVAPFALVRRQQRLVGVNVGSRTMQEQLGAFMVANGVKPVIDRVFSFDDAAAAFAHLDGAGHIGKVVIRIA